MNETWLSGGGGSTASLCSHTKLAQQVAQRLSSCRGESPMRAAKPVLLDQKIEMAPLQKMLNGSKTGLPFSLRLCAPSLRSQ